ncbi:MAG: Exonuclease RNase and polymerase, partial [Dehalococcoidia bacterium]|nr:Exonuclease RNase and polymerase [Dehalococcoidia bacterium]
MGIFLALRSIAFDLPQGVLAALLRVVTNHEWPLASFFLEIARERGDTSFLAPKPPHQVVEDVASLSIHDRSHPALSAIEKPIAPDLKRIADFLGADGPLSNSFPGFEYRGEQVQMAQAVAQAFNEGRHLLAEAGTGTGKSLAYLSPSAMMAQQNHVPVVISTNTINLQEQLVNKDIPELIRALASELNQSNGITPTSVGQNDSTASLRVAQLKGRANYLCLRRFASSLGSLQSMEEASFTARLLVWLASTTTGDRAEVAINSRENELWNRVSAQEGNCLSGPCSYVNSGLCFLYRARERAASSHMVVVNHALLVSDIVRDGAVLPDHDYLVIDEAHHLEDVATEQMGYRVALRDLADYLDHLSRPGGGGRPQGLLSTVQGLLTQEGSPLYRGGALAQRIDSLHGKVSSTRSRGELLYQILGRILNTHGEDSGGYSRRLRITPNVRKHEVWRDLEQAWENLHLSLEELERDLSRVAGAIEELAREKEDPWVDLLTEVAAALPAGSIIHRQMTTFISAPDPDGIYWLESQNQGQSPLMCAAPLDVSAALDKLLFSKRKSVVLTSATLQTEGNFEYIKGRLGLKAPEELAVGSPFEYLNTTLIYTPKDMPGPERPGYMETLDRALVEMCSATGGRALVLFTSHSALQRAYNSVKEPLGRADIQVLGQTVDGTPAYILSTFKSQPRTVLMGTSSFWEGVDVVGDALSLLVITRLPFTVPTDPVFAARSQQFSDPFNQFAIPQAILRFR